jgi:hypothetical protein
MIPPDQFKAGCEQPVVPGMCGIRTKCNDGLDVCIGFGVVLGSRSRVSSRPRISQQSSLAPKQRPKTVG